jgi:tetratricopeptide (TPR) repeat protein
MRLSGRTGAIALCCIAGITLFACKTGGPSVKPTEQPHKTKAEKKYTRIGFGEELEALLQAGKMDEALALFDTVPEPDASEASIRMLKLSILISAKKTDEATTLANELETANPKDPDILYIQAMLADAKNDTKAKNAYLNRVIAVKPDHSQALTSLGLDALSHKGYPQAKTLFLKALVASPDNVDALLGLARVYYMQNDLKKSGETLNLAIQKESGYGALWAERARVKSETGDLTGALADIAQAIKLDPDVATYRIDQGNYYITCAKKEEARAAFSEAIRLEPDNYIAYIYRAGLNDDLGHTDEAISDYAAVCRLYPQYYYANESLGVLLWGKGDYEGSGEAFKRALVYDPKNTSYALMLTLSWYRQNQDDRAKQFMSKYITTLDQSTIDYYVCRLFADKSGDTEVLDRILKEKDKTKRNRMLFYSATFYDLFLNKTIAQKFYAQIIAEQAPTFFEYRLCQWALRDLEHAGDTPANPAPRS